MRPPLISSLTPLWRTRHFPPAVQQPLDTEASKGLPAANGKDTHSIRRTPDHVGLLKGLTPAMPITGAFTRPGAAELDAKHREEVAWLSQVAQGSSGAYLLHAQEACLHVKALLTRGSNALHDAQVASHKIPALQMQACRHQNTLAQQAVQDGKISARIVVTDRDEQVLCVSVADYSRYAEPAVRLVGYANCSLQASTAYCHLVRHLPQGTPVDICEVRDVDHMLVVIGRRPGSDPNNMDSWGPDAVVCDPWAGACYPLSQYPEMQKPARDVKTHAGRSGGHYLGGPLQVMTGWIPLLT